MTFLKNLLKNMKFIYGLLLVSLALNMFIIGTAAYYGARFHAMRNDKNWIDTRIERTEKHLLRFLDDDADKALVREAFDRRRPQVRQAFKEMRQARRDLYRALRQENTNPDALVASINRSQQAIATVNKNGHGLLSDLATGLSADARKKIADHVRRRNDRKGYKNDD